jgi:hypothetical protein
VTPTDEHQLVRPHNHGSPAGPVRLGLQGRLEFRHIGAQQLLEIGHVGRLPGDPKNHTGRRNKLFHDQTVRSRDLVEFITLTGFFAMLTVQNLLIQAYRRLSFTENRPHWRGRQNQNQ